MDNFPLLFNFYYLTRNIRLLNSLIFFDIDSNFFSLIKCVQNIESKRNFCSAKIWGIFLALGEFAFLHPSSPSLANSRDAFSLISRSFLGVTHLTPRLRFVERRKETILEVIQSFPSLLGEKNFRLVVQGKSFLQGLPLISSEVNSTAFKSRRIFHFIPLGALI